MAHFRDLRKFWYYFPRRIDLRCIVVKSPAKLNPRPQRTLSTNLLIQFEWLVIIMQQQNNRTDPQKHLESKIRNIVTQASREKLLPKIMWNAAREFGSKKLINYQKSVRRQYENELKLPQKYDPEAAKSDRQKFRDKVVRLMNHQLQIEYFENIKLRDRTAVTYHGHEIQQLKIETKKEYEMFNNFNEKRFKQTYTNIFDDKLQLDYEELYQNKSKKRSHTLHVLESKHKEKREKIMTQASEQPVKVYIPPTSFNMRASARKKDVVLQSARKKGLIYFNQKKIVGNLIPHSEEEDVLRIMKNIGKFDSKIQKSDLSLTKESINKWLRNLYEKSSRIIDFLQLKDVISFSDFWQISKRLRMMPLQHVLFMTFLYYDGNNDGYICDYDLERICNLSLRRNVLTHDYQKIKQSGIKKLLTKKENYLQLYKLSQVTQTKYFEWSNKEKPDEIPHEKIELQMKNRVLSSKQKQIFVDFSAFCSIFKFDKPFLWFDLIYSFSGAAYQGLRYN